MCLQQPTNLSLRKLIKLESAAQWSLGIRLVVTSSAQWFVYHFSDRPVHVLGLFPWVVLHLSSHSYAVQNSSHEGKFSSFVYCHCFLSTFLLLSLVYFPCFEKIKISLWDHVAVCVCPCILPIVARQQLGKSPLTIDRQGLGKNSFIVAGQRLGKNPPIVYRQRLGKNTPIVARQRLGRNVAAVTNTHATIEEFLDEWFSMWPVTYQGM
jgi:hypothetical protein